MAILQTNNLTFIKPNWPASKAIKAYTSTRLGGFSKPPYQGFNLAFHVEDNFKTVLKNRKLLSIELNLPSEPFWLDQRHTTDSLYFSAENKNTIPVADASWADKPNLVSIIMTADCLPLLITNKSGTLVSAIHAGWQGLANGVVQKSIQALPENPANLMVWIGPAISQDFFEVGEDVRQAFVKKSAEFKTCFKEKQGVLHKYLANLPDLVKIILNKLGVQAIYSSDLCTFKNEDLFYSYRREGVTGRIVSLIWCGKENI